MVSPNILAVTRERIDDAIFDLKDMLFGSE